MQNQSPQQSFIGSNAQANNTTCILLATNRHMINGLTLRTIDNTAYNNNLIIHNINYAKYSQLTLAEIDHRLNQLQNGLRKLKSDVLTIYN